MFSMLLNEKNFMSVYCEKINRCNSAIAYIGHCTCTNQRKHCTRYSFLTYKRFIYSVLNWCNQIALITFTYCFRQKNKLHLSNGILYEVI